MLARYRGVVDIVTFSGILRRFRSVAGTGRADYGPEVGMRLR